MPVSRPFSFHLLIACVLPLHAYIELNSFPLACWLEKEIKSYINIFSSVFSVITMETKFLYTIGKFRGETLKSMAH